MDVSSILSFFTFLETLNERTRFKKIAVILPVIKLSPTNIFSPAGRLENDSGMTVVPNPSDTEQVTTNKLF